MPMPEYGDASDVMQDVQVFGRHDIEFGGEHAQDTPEEIEAINRAIVQGMYFETPSINVSGVRVNRHGTTEDSAWFHGERELDDWMKKRIGIDVDLDIEESVLGPALLQTRKVFSDNQRAKHERHLRSGKINGKVLGKRASVNDERLFKKKRLPGKQSYSVIIGIDISGSTVGVNIALAKRAAMAQAELCARVGIDFAVYCHSTHHDERKKLEWSDEGEPVLDLDIYEVKGFNEPWAEAQRTALAEIGSWMGNLDGHSIEYYRKMVERTDATDKIILYYSDGKMPASNHDEELAIMQREIQYCKTHNITLMGVGIRTDSPRQHGLDTVQVDTDEDLVKVVKHLEKVLLRVR